MNGWIKDDEIGVGINKVILERIIKHEMVQKINDIK